MNGPTDQEIVDRGCVTQLTVNGKPTDVKIRMLPIRQYEEYFIALSEHNEAKMVSMLAQLTAAVVDSLSIEDHEKVIAEGERLNSAPFGRWAKRRQERQVAFLADRDRLIGELAATALLKNQEAPSRSSEPPRLDPATF